MKENAWCWKDFLSKEDTKHLINFIEKNYDFSENEKSYKKELKNTNKVKCISWGKLKQNNLIKDIVERFYIINEDVFGYNLNSLKNSQVANFTEYPSTKKGEYKWHIDASPNHLKDIKLTGIINLSDKDYEGGEFQLSVGEIIDLPDFSQGGDMILFKSNTIHRVLPVTKGTRKTLTFFIEGPRFI